jgi:hypothetical protein
VLGLRAAQLSADGTHLVFMSEARLTAYDNVNTDEKCGRSATQGHSCSEVYVYDVGSGSHPPTLSCASCDPSGAPPQHENGEGSGTFLPFSTSSLTYTPRVVSADGSRVFFDSDMNLAPPGTENQGVYEWEEEGANKATDSCAGGSPYNGGGCVYLIAGAKEPAYLVGTDENGDNTSHEGGDNVFFVTKETYTAAEHSEAPQLYDARIDGGFPIQHEAIEEPHCKTTEECRHTPTAPPVEPFPATTAFSGAENLLVSPPPPRPAVKSLTNAQKLAAALKVCRKQDKGNEKRHKREACERAAHKRYAAVKTKTPSHKRRAPR